MDKKELLKYLDKNLPEDLEVCSYPEFIINDYERLTTYVDAGYDRNGFAISRPIKKVTTVAMSMQFDCTELTEYALRQGITDEH